MSALTTSIRRHRRAAGCSAREICLVGIASPDQSEWAPGDAVSIAGRVYRVMAVDGEPLRHATPSPRYAHLANDCSS